MRWAVSPAARRLARPVSASVAARSSATASVRMFATVGAASITALPTWSASSRASGRGRWTSTDPITSPPTSDGTQEDGCSSSPQTSQDR